ncbi:hypothetical protein ACHAXT_006727 [Thalassiosira profunda]
MVWRHVASTRLPVGAFVDLDSVAPKTHHPSAVDRFVRPLVDLERRINGSGDNVPDLRMEAYGSPRALRRRVQNDNGTNAPRLEDGVPWPRYDPKRGLSGVDKNGVLRCGVCSLKIELTKKEKRDRNVTSYGKLKKHLTVHKKEQRGRRMKRQARRRKNRGKAASSRTKTTLSEKEWEAHRKYEVAVAGLKEIKQQLKGKKEKGKENGAPWNAMFASLRQAGVRAKAEDYSREYLTRAADRWMEEAIARGGENGEDVVGEKKGVLVVCSKNHDFVPLLSRARRRGFVAVAATDEGGGGNGLPGCDVVVGPYGEWMGASSLTLPDIEGVGYTVSEVSPGPLALLSESSSSDSEMCAVPISDDGFHFMSNRQQEASNCNTEDAKLQWHLGEIAVASLAPKVVVPTEPVSPGALSMMVGGISQLYNYMTAHDNKLESGPAKDDAKKKPIGKRNKLADESPAKDTESKNIGRRQKGKRRRGGIQYDVPLRRGSKEPAK